MSSHAILRTNVALTTNAKIVVGGTYSLYVDSIISNTELSSSRYKRLEFNKNNYWDEILPYFFRNTPVDIAFGVRDNEDNDNMSTDFSKQFDDLYQYGARNITENKDYSEEFEYFAPLYISKNRLPSHFVIFRIDGPGIITLNKDNFKSQILDKLKCIKTFDLSRKTPLGEWLDLNINKNKSFPETPFYMDFRKMEFSSWFGVDYEDGGYSEKSFMLDSMLEFEQTFLDFEKFVFDGFKNNKVVFPHIFNFSYLFDDTPATPSSLRKWSLNRYLGFYLDNLELVKNVSPYLLPDIKDDVTIDKYNILSSKSGGSPFVESWKKDEYPYIEIEGNFYKVQKYYEKQQGKLSKVKTDKNTYEEKIDESLVIKYKIISNITLEGKESEINKNLIKIEYSNLQNKLTYYDGTPFVIDNFDDSDVWLIEIDGNLHNIVKEDADYYINSDYAFYQTLEKFDYYINDPDPNYRKSISLKVDDDNTPKKFGIYRCKFTDIKDFDDDIVETRFSKHEYIKKNQLTITDEPKMYLVNQQSNTFPKDYDDFKINGVVANIPASSEYTANSETFRIVSDKLSALWKKNAQRVKWGFQNSISSNDYPYLLNNSFTADDFNRTVNPFEPNPSRVERNLDHFLTINPDGGVYTHHSLHVNCDEIVRFNNIGNVSSYVYFTNVSNIGLFSIGDRVEIVQDNGFTTNALITDIFYQTADEWCIQTNIPTTQSLSNVGGQTNNLTSTAFNLDRYLNLNYDLDYFSYLFGQKTSFDSGQEKLNTKKWSIFNDGDNTIPNITLFRGLKFKLWDVDGVKLTEDKIDAINIKSNNTWSGYKFSILTSKNNYTITSSVDDLNIATISRSDNQLRWQIIDEWKHDKIYSSNVIVKHRDILYLSLTQSQIIDPNTYPYNSPDWTFYTQSSIFWTPSLTNNMTNLGRYLIPDSNFPPLVFNNGDYYYSTGDSDNNFWNPTSNYNIGDVVLHRGKLWTGTTVSVGLEPGTNQSNEIYWIENPNETSIWSLVELWKPDFQYDTTNSKWGQFSPGHYVVHDNVVYVTLNTPQIGVEPNKSSDWLRVYSLVPDTNFLYRNYFDLNTNPIIEMNNRFYICLDNGPTPMSPKSTLENGINIYINKKWKNVLINIYVNDNTFAESSFPGIGVQYTTYQVNKDYLSNTNRDDLYSDIYSKLTANNLMNAINDLENFYEFTDKIKYIIINEDSTINIYDFGNFNTLSDLPVLITCEGPDEFLTRIQSNKVEAINLSESEIKPKRKLDNGNIVIKEQLNHFGDTNLAVTISKRTDDPIKIPNYSGIQNQVYNTLHRHSGYYSPIFHDIELFKSPSLTQSYGNYKFDTDLTYFGTIKERMVSKINRNKNILKLRNNPNIKSIYPMLDEYGYHNTDFFIFKSSWDFEYHIECVEVPQVAPVLSNQSLAVFTDDNNTNNNNLSQL